MKSPVNRVVVAAGVLSCLAVLLVLAYRALSDGRGLREPEARADSDRVIAATTEAPPTGELILPEAPVVVREESPDSGTVVTGIVRNRLTRAPVPATVAGGGGQGAADAETGAFELFVTREERLVVSASGYREHSVALDLSLASLDLGVIYIVPESVLEIRVADAVSGSAVPDAEVVFIRDDDGDGVYDVEEIVGRTDDHGSLGVDLRGEQAHGYARLDSNSSPIATIEGDESLLELQMVPAAKLRVHDSQATDAVHELSFQPLAFRFRVALRRSAMSGEWIADALPAQALSVVNGGETRRILECRPGSRTDFSRWVCDIPASDEIEISVSSPGQHVVLEDAESGERLTTGMLWIECLFEDGWARVASAGSIETAEEGIFRPVAFERISWDPTLEFRFSAHSPGYATGIVTGIQELVRSNNLITVALRRQSTGALRIVDGEGAPYPHAVIVRKASLPYDIHAGPPSPDGTIESITCASDDIIEVATGPHRGDYRTEVAASLILSVAPDPYTVAIPTGTLVGRVAEGNALVIEARSIGGAEFTGVREGSSWRFTALPAGSYAVGPEDFLRKRSFVEYRGGNGYPTTILAGETTTVDLRHFRALAGPIVGRLACRGIEPESLFVSPLYGPDSLPISDNPSRKRFAVGADGTYQIEGLELEPGRLYAGYVDRNGDEVPVGLITGSNTVIECATLAVRVPELPAGSGITILWVPKLPGSEVLGMHTTTITSREVYELGPMPVSTSHVIVMGEDGVIPIALKSGETFELTIQD